MADGVRIAWFEAANGNHPSAGVQTPLSVNNARAAAYAQAVVARAEG